MNYQNEKEQIKLIEENQRREELDFTGIVTDIIRDKHDPNRYILEISNRHVYRYLYDKPVFKFWIETDIGYYELFNKLNFRIIEFNFKNSEINKDYRDREIIITKIYGSKDVSEQTRDIWNLYPNIKEHMISLTSKRSVIDAINDISDENQNISDVLMEKVSFPGHSYYWLSDFVFSIFSFNHKSDLILFKNDVLFMECFVNFILKEIIYYTDDNKEYNYSLMYRSMVVTIVDYLKERISHTDNVFQITIVRDIYSTLENLYKI